MSGEEPARVLLERGALDVLIALLAADGYQVIGPKIADGAVVYEPLSTDDELPAGWIDRQRGGHYRLERNPRPALFDYVVGPHSWKRYLFPPRERLWRAERTTDADTNNDAASGRFTISSEPPAAPRYAFIGVRSCEIRAMQIQDRVFNNDGYRDAGYSTRRDAALIVAVNCGRPGGSCFCVSTDSGPRATDGFDLALTELLDERRHVFVAEAGSERGRALLARLPHAAAAADDVAAAAAVSAAAAAAMTKQLPKDAEQVLKRNPEHPRWAEVAGRCLSCGNCTLVCPTCFCTTVEDTTDLGGDIAERWRQWDSCFSVDFSYLHGGSIRASGRSRYRQWLSHKLAYWHDQFGSSGCVGCGRCISWCPVGIDLTEEVDAIRANDGEVSP